MVTSAGTSPLRALFDTSIFVAIETGRTLSAFPQSAAVSVVTLAELQLGVLMADLPEIRSRRLSTLTWAQSAFRPLSIDGDIARTFAELNAEARRGGGRRPNVMDAWIAATAVAHSLPLFTQDRDFLAIPRVQVVLV